MKITTHTKPLLDALKTASSALPKKTTLPVLTCALIEGDKNGVRVTCDNLDARMTVQVEGMEFKGDFAFLAPPRLLAAALRGEEASIKVEDGKIVVDSGGRTQLMTMPLDEFPKHEDEIETVACDGMAFLNAITATVEAASDDPQRWVIKSVNWDAGIKEMSATNSKILLTTPLELPLALSIIIPDEHARIITAQFTADESLTIGVHGTKLCIQSPRKTLVSKLTEGNYPNYRQVIPTGLKKAFTVDREALQSALVSLGDFVEAEGGKITMKQDGDKLALLAGTKGNDTCIHLESTITGTVPTVGISRNLLLKLIKGWKADELHVDMGDEISPLLFHPGSSDSESLGVIMPMRV